MIPKIAHFIWFGPQPYWVSDNIELFKYHHSEWQIKLHSEITNWLDYIPESLQKIAFGAEMYCTRSDILSYSILEKEGGIYLDADILTLRSIDDLLQYDCFAGYVQSGQINCAVVGSVAHSKAISRIIEGCETRNQLGKVQRSSFGPRLLSRLFINRKFPEMTLLPYHYFYPFREPIAAHKYWKADNDVRKEMIFNIRDQFTDMVDPYLVHLWGVDGSGLRKIKEIELASSL